LRKGKALAVGTVAIRQRLFFLLDALQALEGEVVPAPHLLFGAKHPVGRPQQAVWSGILQEKGQSYWLKSYELIGLSLRGVSA